MANDFMRNANKMVLDGEVVSFSDTFPIVEAKEVIAEAPIVEEPKKEEKIEETVVETKEEEKEIDESEDEETTEETIEDDEE